MVDSYEQEQEFILNLGHALVKWQEVEGAVYGIFREFMKGIDQDLISVTFHHIQSFESKIQLINKCAYFALPKGSQLAERWHKKKEPQTLFKRLLGLMALRNRLVHLKYQTSTFFPPALGPSFLDATYAINEKWKNPNFEIDREALLEAQREFEKLAKDLRQFSDDFKAISK